MPEAVPMPSIERQAEKLARSQAAIDGAAARPKGSGPRFPVVFLDDATAPVDADYIIKGILDRGRLCVIYGPSGDGKTFFTADLAGHIAAGMPWRGRRVRSGLVVYVAAEAGTSIIRRFFAWREQKLSETREGRTPLAIVTRGANLLDVVDVEALIAALRDIAAGIGLPLALIVFDTLSRSIPGGDENRSEDMTRVIEAADRIRDELGAATAVVHHSGKDSQKGARGHSSLFAAADTVISVVDKVATIEKARDGLQGDRFPFTLDVVDLGSDADGDAATTCVVRHIDELPAARKPKRKLSPAAHIGLQALREALDEHGQTMPGTSSIPAGVRATTIERWRERFGLRYGSDGDGEHRGKSALSMAFRRAREQLAAADAVMVSDPYVWITR